MITSDEMILLILQVISSAVLVSISLSFFYFIFKRTK